jgi:hypothetical protein
MPLGDRMRQNVTDLKPSQLSVLERLLAGQTVTDAAKAGGVSRATVHRWLKEDYSFQAELNRSRHELNEAIGNALLSTALRATTNVAAAIEGGDVSASLKLLKGIGALSGQPVSIMSDDADILRHEEEIARQAEDSDRDLRRLLASLG